MPTKSFPAKRKPPDLRRNGLLSLSLCTNMKADLTNGRRETKEDEAGRKGSLSLSLSLANQWTNPRKEEPSRID
jgi:hypothetical protein